MSIFFFRQFLFVLPLFFAAGGYSQKSDWQVTRCGGVDRSSPISNVWVDSENNKWTTNSRGVFKVQACDLASQLSLEPGEQSVYGFRGGNADVRWTTEEFQRIAKPGLTFTAAWSDAAKGQLYIGTKEEGVYIVDPKTKKVVERLHSGNTKLKSNHITNIFQDSRGRTWIGSKEGMVAGTPGKWKGELEGYDVHRIRQNGADIYVLADGEFWVYRNGDKLEVITIDEGALDREPFDFDIDAEGMMWILSSMVSRYNLNTDEFIAFSGTEYYTSEFGICIAADQDTTIWVGTDDKGLYKIEKSSAVAVNLAVEKELSCNGPGNDAALRVKVSGGKPPYTYAWSATTMTGTNPQGVTAGQYTLTVTDATGKSKTAKVKVNDAKLTLTAEVKKSESGPGKADGAAGIKVEGGTGPYTYKWSNGETSANAEKLPEGTHSVTVNDSKGCSATASLTMGQKVVGLAVVVSETVKIKCPGERTGIKAAIDGGKPPFKFQWNNPAITAETAADLPAGEYSVTVTDANGTTAVAIHKVTEPSAIAVDAQVTAPASTGGSDGKATVKALGGGGSFKYAWSNGETTASAVKLPAGKHTVTITDANGCTALAAVEITENILPLGLKVIEPTPIACFGGTSEINMVVNGGKPPYTYAWSGLSSKDAIVSSAKAGNYVVTVTDATGATITINYNLKEPTQLTAATQITAPAGIGTADGKATVTAGGGVPPYGYAWDNNEAVAAASKLSAGKHTVTVTDSKGCTATATVDITENILPLSLLLVESSTINCKGGETNLQSTIRGGKGPFTYAWSAAGATGEQAKAIKAGTYTLTVTDVTGATITANYTLKEPEAVGATVQVTAPASTDNKDGKATVTATGGTAPYTYAWDTGETTASAAKLGPGKHIVSITDSKGCGAMATVEITENILPLSVLITENEPITCNGGEGRLQAAISGGKQPYKINWSSGTVESLPKVKAGAYQITITDALGATATGNFTFKEPEALVATATVTASASTGNADGKAMVTIKGGTAPFTFAWDNKETDVAATKLAPGAHTVSVTDSKGCKTTASVEITENILPLAVKISEAEAITCNGGQTDLASLVSGGKGPFKYAWSSGTTSEKVSGLKAGTYQVTVTDALGTTAVGNFTVKEPAAITVSIKVTAPATTNNADGKAIVSATGGSESYAFNWDNGEYTASASKLAPGKRSVTVTDDKGCSTVATIDIGENIQPLVVKILETGTIKCAGEKISLKVDLSGGKSPFTFAWNQPGLSGDAPAGIGGGTYEVTVTDASGQNKSASVVIKIPAALEVAVGKNIGATTDRSKDGRAGLKVKGGTPPYNIVWDNGEKGATADKLTAGDHTATVTDANGCSKTAMLTAGLRILPALTPGLLTSGQTIRMEQLRFDADSTNVKEESYPVLNELYDFMEENGAIVIEIGGHTNSTPSDEFCDRLSTARAKSVADYLLSKGIDSKRVVYKGYGKRKPIASNLTAAGRAENQRVEIKILKLGD